MPSLPELLTQQMARAHSSGGSTTHWLSLLPPLGSGVSHRSGYSLPTPRAGLALAGRWLSGPLVRVVAHAKLV